MDQRPIQFKPTMQGEGEATPSSDDRLDAWIAGVPPCPDLPSTPEEIAASDARANADIAAGRVVPQAEVAAWLRALARGEKVPRPRPWLK